MNVGRGPTRPGLVKSRIAHRSPRPFSIGVPVSASRVWAGMRRSCWAVSLAGFLIACASSSTRLCPGDGGEGVDVADRRGVGGDRRCRRRRSRLASSSADGRDAPWCTTTRRLGREPGRLGRPVADDGGRGDRRAPVPLAGGAGEVGEHGRRLAEAHVEGEAAAEVGARRGTRSTPAPRPGSVRSSPAKPVGPGDRRDARPRRPAGRCRWPSCCRRPSTPPASPDPSSPMLWRRISAPVSWVTDSRSASAAAASSRSTRSISTQRPRDCTSGRAWRGQPGDLGGGQLDVVEQRRPA